jgi:hypothetical protein
MDEFSALMGQEAKAGLLTPLRASPVLVGPPTIVEQFDAAKEDAVVSSGSAPAAAAPAMMDTAEDVKIPAGPEVPAVGDDGLSMDKVIVLSLKYFDVQSQKLILLGTGMFDKRTISFEAIEAFGVSLVHEAGCVPSTAPVPLSAAVLAAEAQQKAAYLVKQQLKAQQKQQQAAQFAPVMASPLSQHSQQQQQQQQSPPESESQQEQPLTQSQGVRDFTQPSPQPDETSPPFPLLTVQDVAQKDNNMYFNSNRMDVTEEKEQEEEEEKPTFLDDCFIDPQHKTQRKWMLYDEIKIGSAKTLSVELIDDEQLSENVKNGNISDYFSQGDTFILCQQYADVEIEQLTLQHAEKHARYEEHRRELSLRVLDESSSDIDTNNTATETKQQQQKENDEEVAVPVAGSKRKKPDMVDVADAQAGSKPKKVKVELLPFVSNQFVCNPQQYMLWLLETDVIHFTCANPNSGFIPDGAHGELLDIYLPITSTMTYGELMTELGAWLNIDGFILRLTETNPYENMYGHKEVGHKADELLNNCFSFYELSSRI